MKTVVRELRRAPARVIATVFSVALALAAIGVLATPEVARSTLDADAKADHVAHVTASTTPITDVPTAESVDGADVIEGRVVGTAELTSGEQVTVVGGDWTTTEVDMVSPTEGRLPRSDGEVVVSVGVAAVGDLVELPDGTELEVVGVGETTAFATESTIYATPNSARAAVGAEGFNELVVRTDDTSEDALLGTVDELRTVLATKGASYTSFPSTLPGGEHPIQEGITQISTLIGMLGIMAAVVALVLLASTTNTLITERSHEVAVMRALGGRPRVVRRRLRRIAIVVAAAGVLIGVPLGIVVANVIARMVLTRFAGITPGIGFSLPVILGSIAFALIGARLVAGRAARRVAKVPLAEGLRDRDGAPFGRRLSDRIIARIPTGGLFSRLAIRSGARRGSRSIAIALQVAAGVGAAVCVASLATSVTSFNNSEVASWRWSTLATPVDPGYPYAAGLAAGDPDRETAIEIEGNTGDWGVEVFGVAPATTMVDTKPSEGRWLDTDPTTTNEAVIATGLADSIGLGVGDEVDIRLPSGTATYEIVGTNLIRSTAFFVDRDDLGATLGAPGRANVVWSHDTDPGPVVDGAGNPVISDVQTVNELYAEDQGARQAILAIFTAIAVIVVSVAALGMASTLAVNLHDRRHELATMRAMGGRRMQIVGLLAMELLPLVLAGWAIGLGIGWVGSSLIMAAFEQGAGVELGYTFATNVIPITALAALAATAGLVALSVRGMYRRSPAFTLRTAG